MDDEEAPFLEVETFIPFLNSSITKRGAQTATVIAVNAILPANSVPTVGQNCKAEELIPLLAKIIRSILGTSSTVLRIGPGILICMHLSPRAVDPEMVGLQVERSIKRIFNVPLETQGMLLGSYSYDPSLPETEEALRHFLCGL